MIRLLVIVVAVITAGVLGHYFYERAKELRLAEERAKAVGERVFLVEPDVVLPAQPTEGEGESSADE